MGEIRAGEFYSVCTVPNIYKLLTTASYHWSHLKICGKIALTQTNVFRLLLWDCDERSYSYYIEVSTNQQQWTKVIDRTRVACR